MDKPYRILSLDGGGIRGLVPALVLASLEAETGKRITDLFDLVVGTSTGGILALALTAENPPTAEELVGLYEKEGGRIFDRSFWRRLPGHALLDEKYSAKGLVEVLEEYLGEDSLLSDATTDVLVTSYALERRMPFLFKSTKAQDPATKKTHDFKLWRSAAQPRLHQPSSSPTDSRGRMVTTTPSQMAEYSPTTPPCAPLQRLWARATHRATS